MEIKPIQKITLSPTHRLVESMKILQMTAQELCVYLREQAEVNPLIDIDIISDFERSLLSASSIHAQFPVVKKATEDEDKELSPGYESAVIQSAETLQEHLLAQVLTQKLTEKKEQLCRYAIGCLNEKGFLEITPDEIAEHLHVPKEEVLDGLSVLRDFDPPGVFSSSLEECLIYQAKKACYPKSVLQMIEYHLEDLAKGHFSAVSKAIKIPLNEVRRNVELIAALNPFPGQGFRGADQTQYLIPDIEIVKRDGSLKAVLCWSFHQLLSVNTYYSELLRTTDDESLRDYLKRKLYAVNIMEQAIINRERTLQTCSDIILEAQMDFFKGTGALKPLSITDVAERLGVNASTVSRALRGKYIQCYHGTIPVNSLFPGKLINKNGNERSNVSAKDTLRELIASEDKRAPFSDQQLVSAMSEKGFKISRRAVAKYREQLEIPSSYLRQKKE